MNKNYRLLSFRSFFIFFHFYLFSRGLPPAGFFRVGGGEEAKNTVLPDSFFYIQIFSLFFILHFFTFLHFLHFQIFSLFYIFTIFRFFHFLHFYIFTIFPRSLSPWYIQEVCIFYFLKRGCVRLVQNPYY